MYFSNICSASIISLPFGTFSIKIVGAPIIPVGITHSESGTSSGEIKLTSPCFLIASIAINFPIYGSPPPPVPKIAAPTERFSISLIPILRAI